MESCKAVLKICAMCCKGSASDSKDIPQRLITDIPLRSCTQCRTAYYCGVECQKKAWKVHKAPCKALAEKGLISCIQMSPGVRMETQYLKPDDPRFDLASPSKIMHLIGIPLCLLEVVRGENNQWATFFMADPYNGLAPRPFDMLGTVLICRRDRVPITKEQIAQLGDYFCGLMDEFGDPDNENVHKRSMTKKSFTRFLASGHSNGLGLGW